MTKDTSKKGDDHNHQFSPSEFLKNYWKKQKLSNKTQGFTLKIVGRTGTFYFREGNRAVELDVEMAGSTKMDLIIFNDKFDKWIDIERLEYDPMSVEDQKRFRNLLIDWLKSEGIRYSLGGVPYSEIKREE